jgi:hypothetical protein
MKASKISQEFSQILQKLETVIPSGLAESTKQTLLHNHKKDLKEVAEGHKDIYELKRLALAIEEFDAEHTGSDELPKDEIQAPKRNYISRETKRLGVLYIRYHAAKFGAKHGLSEIQEERILTLAPKGRFEEEKQKKRGNGNIKNLKQFRQKKPENKQIS